MENVDELCKFKTTYSLQQENAIQSEFQRVKGQCYLDHAGATLYSEKQIENVFSELGANTFANPHAGNNSSKSTEDAIDQIRYRILRLFNTTPDEYSVVFTSGTTAALKLVGESFVYTETPSDNDPGHGTLAYLLDNHTSVLGMREYSKNDVYFYQEEISKILSKTKNTHKNSYSTNSNSLFVYPAQSNFSGTKYPLWWIESIKNNTLNGYKGLNSKWFVLLDAACFVSTNALDLTKYKPDFVTVSFYKIFGYPTGLGALLVRNSSAQCLRKKYYGGGTVLMALSREKIMVPRNVLHESFEDGTLPFLSIIALRHGFATLERLNLKFELISKHTFELAKYVYRSLTTYHHSNGKPLAILYHDTDFSNEENQGAIVNFNLLRNTGEYIGYAEVLHVANLYGIHLRTGCSCNPGACQTHLKLSSSDVKHHFKQGHVCGDQKDLIEGYPTGSVRISFGYMSTKAHADAFLDMIRDYFVSKPLIRKLPQLSRRNSNIFECNGNTETKSAQAYGQKPLNETIEAPRVIRSIEDTAEKTGKLVNVFIYPIKSCAAFSVTKNWKLIPTGLEYDRQWMIITENGVCLTQKHNRRLCLVKPKIDLSRKLLLLTFEGYQDSSVPLSDDGDLIRKEALPCQSKVCGDKIEGWDCGDKAANWLCNVLKHDGLRLLRYCGGENKEASRISRKGTVKQLALANKAQFLLINKASVQWLIEDIPKNDLPGDIHGVIQRFRPNLVVDFEEPLTENSFRQMTVGKNIFTFEDVCTRCQMICIDQSTSEKTVEPLKTLSRKLGGKISFGVYLKLDIPYGKHSEIDIGTTVLAK